MDIKTIDEYILMEMSEESPEVSMRAAMCATTEEYVVKKLVEMEERVYALKDENEALKKENETLREALKNCGKKIVRVAKVLEKDLEQKLNKGLESPAISVRVDLNDDDNDDNDDKDDDNDDYDYSDYDNYDPDDYDDYDCDYDAYDEKSNSNYEDQED